MHAASRHLHDNVLWVLSECQSMVLRARNLLQRGGRQRRRRGSRRAGRALGRPADRPADFCRRCPRRRLLGRCGAGRPRKIHPASRRSPGVRRSRSPPWALVAWALGCGSVPVTTESSVDPSLKVAAVVLEPVRGVGAGEMAALGQRLTSVTLEAVSGEALVWAGAEIQVLHAERSDWTGTTAVPLLRAADIRPEQAVVLRARVVTGAATSQQEVQGASGTAVGNAAELHWRATVEILHPSTG